MKFCQKLHNISLTSVTTYAFKIKVKEKHLEWSKDMDELIVAYLCIWQCIRKSLCVFVTKVGLFRSLKRRGMLQNQRRVFKKSLMNTGCYGDSEDDE